MLGQDEQESGKDQVYTGSGDANEVQFSTMASPTLTSVTASVLSAINSGLPKTK